MTEQPPGPLHRLPLLALLVMIVALGVGIPVGLAAGSDGGDGPHQLYDVGES